MCVVKEGVRDPAARSSCSTASASCAIVAPGTTSGADGRHCLLDGPDRASDRLQLLGRLHPAKLVHERRAGAEAVEAEDPAEIQDRLGPDAVADCDSAVSSRGLARLARTSQSRRPSR